MPAKKSDGEIQRDVLRELDWDPRVEETDVGVEVDDGVVTLTGTVTSWAKRQAAQEAAHRVAGVLDVANDVEVRLPGSPPTDTDIARAVRQTLTWDVFVPEERLRSTVEAGVVTLEGTVDSMSEHEDAERAVQNLAGVRRVVNKIAIASRAPRTTPQEVRGAIEGALERRAQREADRIRVEVEGSRVTLSGRVRSLAEKRAILGAAGYTAGAEGIEDRLVVDPDA